jgi:hypothetical protein
MKIVIDQFLAPPSNEYGAAPVVASMFYGCVVLVDKWIFFIEPSNYSSPTDVAVPPPMQHYDQFANVEQWKQMNQGTNQYEPAPIKQ